MYICVYICILDFVSLMTFQALVSSYPTFQGWYPSFQCLFSTAFFPSFIAGEVISGVKILENSPQRNVHPIGDKLASINLCSRRHTWRIWWTKKECPAPHISLKTSTRCFGTPDISIFLLSKDPYEKSLPRQTIQQPV